MKKCDFCTKSSPSGCCYLANQTAREDVCSEAIDKMVKALSGARRVAFEPLPELYKEDEVVSNLGKYNEGWILCSEKLPENDDNVLCWYEYRIMGGTHEGEMNQEYGIGYYNKYYKRWGGEVSSGRDCKVIAWQPLPEPYTESE